LFTASFFGFVMTDMARFFDQVVIDKKISSRG